MLPMEYVIFPVSNKIWNGIALHEGDLAVLSVDEKSKMALSQETQMHNIVLDMSFRDVCT